MAVCLANDCGILVFGPSTDDFGPIMDLRGVKALEDLVGFQP